MRQFLLGQLSDDKAEEIEERIFAEADFAEEVQIVENELITDYTEGNLAADDRVLFDTKYSKNKTDRTMLEYERLFSEFIRSKFEDNLSRASKSQPSESALSNIQTSVPRVSTGSPRKSSESWLHSLFRIHRALAYSAILIAFLLSVTVVWYLVGHRIVQPDNPLEAQREVIEAALARLNTRGAGLPGKVRLSVNLQPAERSRGAMARVASDTTPDALIEFHLSLPEASDQEYRALFLDDRHRELFSISKLTAQGTPGNSEIRLFVPSIYLNPGDYQINLSVSNKNGGYDDVNSYAVRVVPTR